MKLKKIAALALAGVMAVSMLAGCSGGSNKTESGVTAAAVIDALGKDNKVAFSASSALQSTVEKTIQNIGLDNVSKISVADLAKVDTKLDANEFQLSKGTDTTNEDIDKNSDTFTAVKAVTVPSNYGEDYAVQMLASAIKEVTVENNSKDITELTDYNTQKYGDSSQYYYKFSYTGNVAVVTVPNADAAATETTYVVAFTVTRTAAKTAVPSMG